MAFEAVYRARAYQRGHKLFFHALSRSNDDEWVASEPFVVLQDDSPDSFLGETVLRVLSFSRPGARPSADTKAHRPQLVRLAGARNWTTFVRGTSACLVEQNENGVRVVPARNAGPAREFIPVEEEEEAVDLPVPFVVGRLGAAVAAALQVARPAFRNRR